MGRILEIFGDGSAVLLFEKSRACSRIILVTSLLVFACKSIASEVSAEQACAAVPGNSYWTADELVYAQNLRFMVGKEVVLPSAPGALTTKYERCVREIDDATTFNAHEVMQTYETMTGWSNVTSKLGGMALGMLVPADAGLGGWLTKRTISGCWASSRRS